MKIGGYPASFERQNVAVVLAGLIVLSANVMSGFAQSATDLLPSTGRPKNKVVATIPVGDRPTGVVVNPTSKLVYVANTVSQTVSVIYATTNTVATTISVGYNPYVLAITPDGTTLYVGTAYILGDLIVSVVATTNNTVIKTLDLGALGREFVGLQIAASPDGKKVYVAAGYPDKGVAVIDTSTNLVSGTIKINDGRSWGPPAPNGVVFSSRGRFAYVASVGDRSSGETRRFLSTIDTVSERQISATGPLQHIRLEGPVCIHGHLLYIAAGDSTHVLVFDTRTNMAVKTIPVGHVESDALTPDGKYLYVTYSTNPPNDKVVAFDTETNAPVGSPIQVGQGASGVAVAPDGLRAYVTNSVDGTVSVIDISTQ